MLICHKGNANHAEKRKTTFKNMVWKNLLKIWVCHNAFL